MWCLMLKSQSYLLVAVLTPRILHTFNSSAAGQNFEAVYGKDLSNPTPVGIIRVRKRH